MKSKQVVQELKDRYPETKIILSPNNNHAEIVCEIDPQSKHPEYSIAIAVIEKSVPHYHKITTEEYEVIKGKVTLYLGNERLLLKSGDKIIIKPGIIHWAESNSGWVKCLSRPGWTKNDHFLL